MKNYKTNCYNNWKYILYFFLIFIELSHSGFTGVDVLVSKKPLTDAVRAVGELIPYENSVFGYTYIGADSNLYAAFLQHGILKK